MDIQTRCKMPKDHKHKNRNTHFTISQSKKLGITPGKNTQKDIYAYQKHLQILKEIIWGETPNSVMSDQANLVKRNNRKSPGNDNFKKK